MLRRIVKTFFLILIKILYRIEYVDWEKFPKTGPAIIVANHQHTFDVAFIHCKAKPWVYWIAKKQLFDTPIIGKHVYRMGVMSVDRDRSDIAAAKNMLNKLRENEIIGIFPQGTRMRTPQDRYHVVPKTGAVHLALRTGTPIIPIGIAGTFRLFSKIKVVVGDPVDFSAMPSAGSESAGLMEKTIFVMKKIYGLVGIEYRLDPETLKAVKAVKAVKGRA